MYAGLKRRRIAAVEAFNCCADYPQRWQSNLCLMNRRKKTDAIDVFLRQQKPDNAVVVELNWRDNPFWPDVLEEERQLA